MRLKVKKLNDLKKKYTVQEKKHCLLVSRYVIKTNKIAITFSKCKEVRPQTSDGRTSLIVFLTS